MPVFYVTKSISIAAGPSVVFPLIRDFRKWPAWSPWVLAEPGCRIAYSEDGRRYDWEGRIIGSGRMEILDETPGSIDYRLTFLKPFKSENSTAFRLDEKDGSTVLTWTMTGSLPWFMFWMKGTMSAFIGMDFARGLSMLKDLAETGEIRSKLDFLGEQPFSGFPWVGIRSECSIDRIGESMSADFERLDAWRTESGRPKQGRFVSIYHKWDVAGGVTGYTAAVEVESAPASLPKGLSNGLIPDTRVYSIRHTGPYRHLGNAWSAGMMHGRAKIFEQSKKLHPFELFENGPAETPEARQHVLVQFPLK